MNLFATPHYMTAYGEELHQAINGVLHHNQFILGPEVVELEDKLTQYVGSRCVSVANGTDALYIALSVLDIGRDDEVLVPSFTWVSPVETILLRGATPIFVDVQEDSFNMDPEQIESAITSRTRAIIAVSLFGQTADFSRINALAKKHKLVVIEDAAQSFGACHTSMKSCGLTTIGTTSFFPTKSLGCFGDGGALFTNDDKLFNKIAQFRSHGRTAPGSFTLPGVNSRLDSLQAAILLVKLQHFDSELEKRRRLAQKYNESLSNSVVTPREQPNNHHIYSLYTIKTDARDELQAYLQKHKIPTGIYYPQAVHQQRLHKRIFDEGASLAVTESLTQKCLSIPIHPFLKEEDQDYIISTINSFF